MRGKLIFVLFLFLAIINIQAKPEEEGPLKKMKQIRVVALDTVRDAKIEFIMPDENLNDIFEENLDSLVNSWYVQELFFPGNREVSLRDSAGVVLPDSVYVQQLEQIEAVVTLQFNKTVKNFIQLYTIKRREQVEIMLGLSANYFPIFEEILDKYELPLELKYLPIIESALNPRARSRAGATGLWQFMYGTAKMMGLEITSFVDERRDPLKSSEAAVK